MHQSIGTSRGKLSIKTGSEGPHWDPYSYVEITLGMPNQEASIHMGLGEYLKVNGKKIDCKYPDEEFAKLTGYHPTQWEMFCHKARSRCRKCGCKRLTSSRGYPGEHFVVCAQCGEVVECLFCEREII